MGAMPPRPPMAPPPGGPPPGAPPGLGVPGGLPPRPGMGGPPMPIRKRGGRVGVRNQGPGDHMPPSTGEWKTSVKSVPVQHTDGKYDQKDIGRGKPITYAKGGSVTKYTSVPVHGAKSFHNPPSRPVGPGKRISDPVSRSVPQAIPAVNNASRRVAPAPNPYGPPPPVSRPVHGNMPKGLKPSPTSRAVKPAPEDYPHLKGGSKGGLGRLEKAHLTS